MHIGHLIVAETALEQVRADELWFVVSPQNPFKLKSDLLATEERITLAELSTEDNPNFNVSTIELDMEQPSYTYRTLRKLRRDHDQFEFDLLIGEDNAHTFKDWKKSEEISLNHTIYVYPRYNSGQIKPVNDSGKAYKWISAPRIEVSGTDIRHKIDKSQSIRYLLHHAARQQIEAEGWYKR